MEKELRTKTMTKTKKRFGWLQLICGQDWWLKKRVELRRDALNAETENAGGDLGLDYVAGLFAH